MAAQILALLNRALPIGLATKGISKVNPRIGSFVQGALGSGYTADQVFGFLRSKLEGTASAAERSRLEAGERAGTLRPDERAAREEISQSRRAGDLLQTAAGLGAGVLGGISGMRQAETQQEEPPKEQQPQREMGPREAAASRLNEMQKEKKLIEQLQADFERKYGQTPPSRPEFPGRSQEMGRPAQNRNTDDEQLLALMQNILKS